MPSQTRPLTITGGSLGGDLLPVALRLTEGLSQVYTLDLEAVSGDRTLDLGQLLGQPVTVTLNREDSAGRQYSGVVVSAEALGAERGYGLYRMEIRPFLWFLTRHEDCRIFQDKTVLEIIRQVLADLGYGARLDDRTTDTYPVRTLCVQYRETDLDFLNRLMEEEGIYYFFDHGASGEKMVLADSSNAHKPLQGGDTLAFRDLTTRAQKDFVQAFDEIGRAVSGKVTLRDFDFENPGSNLTTLKALPQGSHTDKDIEVYDYPGHYSKTDAGDRYSRIRMEALAAPHKTWAGQANIGQMTCGGRFCLDRHDRAAASDMFVLSEVEQVYVVSEAFDPTHGSALAGQRRIAGTGAGSEDQLQVSFRAIPAAIPYRSPRRTRWPRIPGVQTAIVTGPAGEEIHTDKYGRVRLQFHWDRLGRKDETATAWVRCMTPWAGKTWGMIHVPRIGQEVVVQFEEGDPDRPLVVGMLYNADNMPPWALDANKTQAGIKTNSTKGGGGFNELMFEDRKGAELVRLQAEKDFRQIVKNNATITVGAEKKDDGNMTLTVQNNLTETVVAGDHTFTVSKGNQIMEVTEGDQFETVKGDVVLTVQKGGLFRQVDEGDMKTEIMKGTEHHLIRQGNYQLKTDLGSILMEAMNTIELKVGQNSITINQSGITIKGIMVKIEGTAMLEAKAPMSTVKGDGLLILKGGLTMIN